MNFDEKVRFITDVSPLDENDTASIQPVTNNERLDDAVLTRPVENLRLRTEVLRKAIEDLKYRSDYGIFLAQSFGRFRLNAVSATTWTIETDASEVSPSFTILPGLTPGFVSGGRSDPDVGLGGARVIDPASPNKYYIGVLGTNDLWIFASTQHTGQRAYADGDTLGDLQVTSIGGNNISVLVRPDSSLASGEIVIDPVTGSPVRHISIRYGDGTTIGDLSQAINDDRVGTAPVGGPSQDGQTWGIADMIHTATTATLSNVLTGVNLLDTGAVPIQMQGAADAEIFTVDSFASFFGTAVNEMSVGESIALAFTSGSVEDAPGYGGRRQSIYDRAADRQGTPTLYTTSDSLLFNTGRFPERIPGAIPIGKCFQDQFVFIDGTVLSCTAWAGSIVHGPWVRLGQNAPFIVALAAATGAASIGTAATGVWNATTSLTAQPAALRSVPAGTVQSSLDAIVAQLGKIDSASSPHDSGARRIGVEAIAPSPTTPNGGLAPLEGSLYEVLAEYLNDSIYGLNARVCQWGHNLRGPYALTKNFVDEAILGGGDHSVGIYGTIGDLSAMTLTVENRNMMIVQPVEWHGTPGTVELLLEEPVSGVGALNWMLVLSHASIATRITTFKDKLPVGCVTTPTGGFEVPVANIVVTLKGFVPGVGKTDTNGHYYLRALSTVTNTVTLARMDALAFLDPSGAVPAAHPDFSTGDFTTATVTFNSTTIIGSDLWGERVRAYHAGYAPFLNLAVHNVDTAILEACVADGATPPPQRLRLTPSAMVFKDGSTVARSALAVANLRFYDAGNVLVRTSDNILKDADKAALDGNETGVPVDATDAGSHHHNNQYSNRLHGHTLCADNVLMVAHDSETGISYGTAPTLTTIDNIITVYPNIAVFEIPTGVMGYTTSTTTGHAIFELVMSLSSTAGTNAMVDMYLGYEIQPYWRDTTAATWNPGGVGFETIFPYDTAVADVEQYAAYVPTGQFGSIRIRRTFAFRLPDLAPSQPTSEVAGYIGFELVSVGVQLDPAASTVSIRHLLTYYDPV